MKTNEELKQIAADIYSGKIYTDAHIQAIDTQDKIAKMRTIFLPFSLMDKKKVEELAKDEPSLIYEYWSLGDSAATNGHPVFTSFRYLTKDEYDIVAKSYNELIAKVYMKEEKDV
jgi:hypothetical protein